MSSTDNPAGRLYGMLSALKTKEQSDSIHTWQGWSELLGTAEQPELFERYARVVALPDQIDAQLKRLGYTEGGLTSHLPGLKGQLADSTTWAQALSSSMSRISDAAMGQLNSASDVLSLSPITREPDVDQVELDDIGNDIRSLLEDIGGANDLDNELRLFLSDHLYTILRAIDGFGISGIVGLKRVMDETVGAWAMEPSAPSSEANDRISTKFWVTVKRLGAIVALVSGSWMIATDIDPALGMPKAELPATGTVQAPGSHPSHNPLSGPPTSSPAH
jgi:hypothetical protein